MNVEKRVKATFYTYTNVWWFIWEGMVVYGQRRFHNRVLDFVKLTVAFNTSGHFKSNH